MTTNSLLVLNFLKKHYGEEFTKEQMVNTLGISLPSITGSINGLVKKGHVVERCEEVVVEPATETRKAKVKTIRYETLTESGLAYDPEEEERVKAAEKAAAKAAKAAAKANAEA